MKLLELDTGLFPDRARVEAALGTLEEAHRIERRDISGLAPEDEDAWADVVGAIRAADSVITK
ncbi:hypothetical protein [Marimonas lutisalis]|uniref:hypothetical protein n=1 Tax=Marimonas lutisalis TaxID=2545756 RepID=UPI0010F7E585|nr:hypothetical protein [Marimonas lutisalis]